MNDDEAKLYDRSIRLWGVEAQNRIRSASVLLVGVGALNGEVCKNVALAGVKRIGLLDNTPLREEDLGALFLASSEHIGTPRAAACEAFVRDLNPYVEVVSETVFDASSQPDEFWKQYDVVCVTKQSWAVVESIADACRRCAVKFYVGDSLGFFGFMFADLGTFTFSKTIESPPVEKNGEKTTTQVMETVECESLASTLSRHPPRPNRVPPLYWALMVLRSREQHGNSTPITPRNAAAVLAQAVADGALPDATLITSQFLADVARGVAAEVPCVAAVLGGILGQELVRAAAADDSPLRGFLLYDMFAGTAIQM